MSEKAKAFLRHSVSIMIIGGLVYYVWKHWGVFNATLHASWHHVLGLILCILVTLLLNSCQVLLLLRALGVKIGFWENMFVLLAMLLGNYLPMRMGSVFRMHYFKKVHGLQYIKFGGVIGVRVLILFISTGIFGSIGMMGLKFSGGPFSLILSFIFAGMILLPLGAWIVPARGAQNPKNLFWKVRSDFLSAFRIMRSNPLLLWQIVGLILMQFAVLATRLYITFDAIQVELSVWALLILAPMTTLISFLSLTPGNLGLREWAIGIISLASGVDFRSGIFAGTLDRAVLMACTFLLGAVSLVYIWARLGGTLRDNSRQQG
jgi:uncharacterized membrane protein YbhN (UPF0104 family)